MKKKEKLERLLALSRRLAALADQERWGDWEAVAEQKEALYRELEPMGPVTAPDEAEKGLLFEIGRLEERTGSVLRRKMEETKKELARIKRARGAIRGYGKAVEKGPERQGLRIRA
jgi:hypothetical protein